MLTDQFWSTDICRDVAHANLATAKIQKVLDDALNKTEGKVKVVLCISLVQNEKWSRLTPAP